MRPLLRRGAWRLLWVAAQVVLLTSLVARGTQTAQEPAEIPSAAEINAMLAREPISLDTWDVWRPRLQGWMGQRSNSTDAAFESARQFLHSQATAQGDLPAPLLNDSFAWYHLGTVYLHSPAPGDPSESLRLAEKALRQSIAKDPNFPQSHRNLALTVARHAALTAEPVADGLPAPALPPHVKLEYDRELAEARRLDPKLPLAWVDAEVAMARRDFFEAERLWRVSLVEDRDPGAAFQLGIAICSQSARVGGHAGAVAELVAQFPDNGPLAAMHGLGLAVDGQFPAAVAAFDRARKLGTDPRQVFAADLVDEIEKRGAPTVWHYAAWILGSFAAVYGLVMLLMVGVGVILARRTRGQRALDLLGASSEYVVSGGQVVRTHGETQLARAYAAALVVGLVTFYLSIPFLIATLLATAGLVLYGIFLLPVIPVKLVVIVVVVGAAGAWAMLKCLFAKPSQGGFGLLKEPADCPRLHAVVEEVAESVDTQPVDQIFLAPGSEIGVHHEGRGPFGVFGVKNRVLTLGLSTLHFLSVSELKSILAHEYAHFSHRDTFYNRFIFQVMLSIQGALQGMASAGGKLNYVNPAYWFLVLYYKSYSLLSAGFSRSREFLADRMATSLYGSDIFASALTKVATDGTLFEANMYQAIQSLFAENKSFVNMYEAFREFHDAEQGRQARQELYAHLEQEKDSLTASHPTLLERLDAIAELPRAASTDPSPAMSLFDDPQAVEKELTDFLVSYLHFIHQAQTAEPAPA